MSNYTVELRKIPENLVDGALSHYPIFMEGYRATLNKKIKNHFWFNEIGHETIDIFLFQLRVKMNEIMPYYNQFYEAELTKRDPYLTLRTSSKTTGSGSTSFAGSSEEGGTSSSDTTARSRAVQSDTPQVRLSGDADYATGVSDSNAETGVKSTQKSTGKQSSSMENSSTGTSSQEGFSGSMASLIEAHRDAIINIDMMVIAQLESLFMYVWTPPVNMIGEPDYGY